MFSFPAPPPVYPVTPVLVRPSDTSASTAAVASSTTKQAKSIQVGFIEPTREDIRAKQDREHDRTLKECERLKNMLATKETEASQVKRQLYNEQVAKIELADAQKVLKRQLEDAHLQLDLCVKRSAELDGRTNHIMTERNTFEKKNRLLEETVAHLRQEVRQVHQNMVQQSEAVRNILNDCKDHKDCCKSDVDLKAELQEARDQRDHEQNKRDELERQHNELKRDHDTLKREHDELKCEHDKSKSEFDELLKKYVDERDEARTQCEESGRIISEMLENASNFDAESKVSAIEDDKNDDAKTHAKTHRKSDDKGKQEADDSDYVVRVFDPSRSGRRTSALSLPSSSSSPTSSSSSSSSSSGKSAGNKTGKTGKSNKTRTGTRKRPTRSTASRTSVASASPCPDLVLARPAEGKEILVQYRLPNKKTKTYKGKIIDVRQSKKDIGGFDYQIAFESDDEEPSAICWEPLGYHPEHVYSFPNKDFELPPNPLKHCTPNEESDDGYTPNTSPKNNYKKQKNE